LRTEPQPVPKLSKMNNLLYSCLALQFSSSSLFFAVNYTSPSFSSLPYTRARTYNNQIDIIPVNLDSSFAVKSISLSQTEMDTNLNDKESVVARIQQLEHGNIFLSFFLTQMILLSCLKLQRCCSLTLYCFLL